VVSAFMLAISDRRGGCDRGGEYRSQALLVGVPASLPDHIIRTVCDRLCRASHFGPTSWAKKQALQP
jgi:hypothetical protein